MTAPRIFATVGLGLTIVGAVGTALVRYVSPAPFIEVAFGFGGVTMVGYLIAGLIWTLVGALLVVRRPENAVGWLMILIGVGYSLSQLSVSMAFAFAAEGTAEGERKAQIAGWVTVLLNLVAIFQVAIGFVFPSGRPQSRGWALFMRLFSAFAIVFLVISLTQPGPLHIIPGLQNPFGFGPDLRGDRPIAPIFTISIGIIFASLAVSMISRYRAAGLVERHQLKWFFLALAISAIGLGIIAAEGIVIHRPTDAIGLTINVFAGAVVPVAIGVAILRYHLFEIDRIISRTLSWALVTGLLSALFVGLVVGLQALSADVSGNNTLAVAASTLVVAALFQPVRGRIQGVVDRRFNRARYDANRIADTFAEQLRSEVDIARLRVALVDRVDEAVRPVSATVWLRAGSSR